MVVHWCNFLLQSARISEPVDVTLQVAALPHILFCKVNMCCKTNTTWVDILQNHRNCAMRKSQVIPQAKPQCVIHCILIVQILHLIQMMLIAQTKATNTCFVRWMAARLRSEFAEMDPMDACPSCSTGKKKNYNANVFCLFWCDQ